MEQDCYENASKLSLIIRKPQEGKTFICIRLIIKDPTNCIHIVLTMNTISAGMQFFSRMEEKISSKKIIVFNSNPKSSGNCHHAKTITDIFDIIRKYPEIKVIVCCAHEKRFQDDIPKLLHRASDSKFFDKLQIKFDIHIDEAHKYIPTNRDVIRQYNNFNIVKSITGYTATPDNIWSDKDSDSLFGRILIRDIPSELNISSSCDYFGVKQCEFIILQQQTDIREYIRIFKFIEYNPIKSIRKI